MKRLYLLLIALVAAWTVSANPVDRQQARQQAETFLKEKGAVVGGEASARSVGHKTTSNQPFYVFNAADSRGFVIVAGDDRIEPIIGYTTQGSFDESDLPVNFKVWLEQTAAEINAIAAQPAQARGTSGPKATIRPVLIHQEIKPLIITTWNQGNTDNVYNAHLPLVDGQLPCTGCVATAGAQVMYYYHRDLPTTTQPVSGYTLVGYNGNNYSNGADTSNDLPAIQFQWDKMRTSYGYRKSDQPTTEEEDAVADLMLYCGYAAQMNYGLADVHGGSSSSISTLADGFAKYFGFNPNTWKSIARDLYSIWEWDEIVYNELACGRPVLYSGSYNNNGHAFICDGYDGAGMYHFNWGWGGNCDGYFKLQATNPKGESDIYDMGYIASNSCIIGLQPNSWPDITDPNADDTWEVIEVEGSVTQIHNSTIEGTTLNIEFWNSNDEDLTVTCAMGEIQENGTIHVLDARKEITIQPWYIRYYSFDVSGYGLSEGTHKLVPLNKKKGESEWKRCKPTDIYYEVVVSGGTYTIIPHPVENLKINEFDLVTGGTPGYSQAINLSITNNGDNLEKELYLYVGTSEDKGDYVSYVKVRIAAGNTKEYRIYTGKLNAGNYTLRLFDKWDGDVVLAQKDITISMDLEVTKFEVIGKKYANKTLRVDATVENHAGDYAVPLYMFINTGSSKKLVYAAGSAIERGSSEIVTFYFLSSIVGTRNLWIATDSNCENIIGQTSVTISEQKPAKLDISSEVQNLSNNTVKGEKITITADVTNTGEYAYDDVIEACLYKKEPDTYSGYQVDIKKQDLQLKSGAKTSLNFTFDNLEDGSDYFCWVYYYSTEDSGTIRYQAAGGRSFTFEYTKESNSTSGDANNDGNVDANDIVAIINFLMGKDVPGFNADKADANGDGSINAADIVTIVGKIL